MNMIFPVSLSIENKNLMGVKSGLSKVIELDSASKRYMRVIDEEGFGFPQAVRQVHLDILERQG